MGGGGSSSKPQMVKDPTLEPLRQDLVKYLGGATKGGLAGLTLPQYQGPYGTGAQNPISSAANSIALNALKANQSAGYKTPILAAFKSALSGSAVDTDPIVADLMRRGEESADLARASLNEQFGAAGNRFSTPLAMASGKAQRDIRGDTQGQIAALKYQAQSDALQRQLGALAPAVEFESNPPELQRALLAAGLAEQANKPFESEIDRRLAEHARTQAALLPFAIQMASAYPPIGTKSSSAQGGIL